jgi:hypothetical protein
MIVILHKAVHRMMAPQRQLEMRTRLEGAVIGDLYRCTPMKIFEVVHFLLISGLVFGVAAAAATHPAGQEFSWILALKQAGIVTLVLVVLLALNFVVARLVSRRVPQRGVTR